jgi:hypothetical protein
MFPPGRAKLAMGSAPTAALTYAVTATELLYCSESLGFHRWKLLAT